MEFIGEWGAWKRVEVQNQAGIMMVKDFPDQLCDRV
jgi:hypothetical protein